MNYLISIPSDQGILGLKLKAVAGELTTINEDRLSIDDEFIATCDAGDSVVLFEAGETVLGETIPAEGIPTGNYELYYTTALPTPTWNLFAEMGTVAIINTDLALLLGDVPDIGNIADDVAQLQADVTGLDDTLTITGNAVTANAEAISDLKTLVYKTRPFIFDYESIGGTPALRTRGIFTGYALPIYNANDEELFACLDMPDDWKTDTNPEIILTGWLDAANKEKRFHILFSVQTVDSSINSEVAASTNDRGVEMETGDWPANASFKLASTVDRTAMSDTLKPGQPLMLRIRRIAASSDEITGNPVILNAVLRYISDKQGGAI